MKRIRQIVVAIGGSVLCWSPLPAVRRVMAQQMVD
jgi:hypothetical protein